MSWYDAVMSCLFPREVHGDAGRAAPAATPGPQPHAATSAAGSTSIDEAHSRLAGSDAAAHLLDGRSPAEEMQVREALMRTFCHTLE